MDSASGEIGIRKLSADNDILLFFKYFVNSFNAFLFVAKFFYEKSNFLKELKL